MVGMPHPDLMTKLQQKLDEMQVSRFALARRTGLSNSTLKRIFEGGRPDFDSIYRIHLATRGRISYGDVADPAIALEVAELSRKYGPLRRARRPGRPKIQP